MKRMFIIILAGLISLPVFCQKHEFTVEKDVKWASPDGFDLTMDIYTPKTGKKKYPVLVIYHGGGWLINNKSIMDEMSAYVASNSEFVVCNVNYRLLVDQENTVTMNEIVEDVLGAIVWIKENIKNYSGDSKKIAVTGDSAGGHLSSMVVLAGDKLGENGFKGESFNFSPSYLPQGKSLEKLDLSVQAAVISYGAFDIYASCTEGAFETDSNIFWQLGQAKARGLFGDSINAQENPEYYKAVSPIYLIPESSEKKLPPQFFMVGSEDNLTTPESVKKYVEKVKEAGHSAEYWVHEGRPHAFLDSGQNEFLGISFEKDAPEALDMAINFLNGVFY